MKINIETNETANTAEITIEGKTLNINWMEQGRVQLEINQSDGIGADLANDICPYIAIASIALKRAKVINPDAGLFSDTDAKEKDLYSETWGQVMALDYAINGRE